MTESHATNTFGKWKVPQCPFTIDYSIRVMDDVRLAVMDAFFSLPHGGAEIGGIFIGGFANGRVTIADYVALDCEHAFGPSFVLSPRDEQKLQNLLDATKRGSSAVPVGWYHSHTRSEIFLSDADVAIHNRFFAEPWQVALVLKPHTFQPMRCGFFFRDSQSAIQAASTYQEFTLDALPLRPVPSGDVPLAYANPAFGETDARDRVINISPERDDVAVAAAAAVKPQGDGTLPRERAQKEQVPGAPPQMIEPPLFGGPAPQRSWRRMTVLLAIGIGIAMGAEAYGTRQLWWPRLTGVFTPAVVSIAYAPIGLSTTDNEGQLQIHWDRESPTVRLASGARLSITDVGPNPREIQIDPVRLQSGSFTYVREGEAVTVMLTLDEPNGRQAREISIFLGKLPVRSTAGDKPEIRTDRDRLAQESARLRQDLAAETERNRKLQKALDEARAQLNEQMRKRLGNQIAK